MGIGSLRDRSARYSGSARGLRKAWQSVRSCEAASTNPALTIRGPHTRGARFGVAEAMLRLRSAPYSGSLRGLGKARQSARNCEAASTHRSVRLSAGHIRALRLGVAEAMLRLQSAPYSGSLRGLGRAWQSVRSCEAASTDWGWASNAGSATGDDPELDRLLEEARGAGREVAGEYYYDMFGRRRLVPAGRGGGGAAVGRVLRKRQAVWLGLGALAIMGPVVALGLGVFQRREGPGGAREALPGMGSVMAMVVAPMVDSGAMAPAVQMTAVPVIEEDGGAAPAVSVAPVVPVPVKTKSVKGRGDDPYDAAVPWLAKTVEAVVPAPPLVTVAPVAPPPVPSVKLITAPSAVPASSSPQRMFGTEP